MNRPALFVGAAFGFLISASRLSDYNVIHDMLLLREFDVFLLMASAVGTAAPILYLLRRRKWRTPSGQLMVPRQAPVEPRNVAGAVVFGTGWAIAGTCPGPAIAMATGGSVLSIAVMAGFISGVFLYDRVALRLTWPPRPAMTASAKDQPASQPSR